MVRPTFLMALLLATPFSFSLTTDAALMLQGRGQGRPAGGQQPPASGIATTAPAQPAAPAENEFAKAVKDFEKKSGVLNTYLKGETLYFEIPEAMFGRDFLWYAELKNTPGGSYSGTEIGSAVVRFEKRGDKVLVRDIDYSVTTPDKGALGLGVFASNVQPIIASLDVKATSDAKSVLIDVTRFFRNGTAELPLAGALGGQMLDPTRTFIDRVTAFPDNINVEVTATASGGGGAAGGRRGGFGGPPPRASNTGTFHHSFVVLPEKPMMGRRKDDRVGYFSYGFTEFNNTDHKTDAYELIARYRLEKKDPSAALSEPVKPIIYYLAPEVPEKWRSYMKQGVRDWNVAFEAAGFKNAIDCQDAPNDPNWSPEDVRYSVIRWAPLPIGNAMGPHVADPRSGEILSAHVIMWHDILKLITDWYFVQASPNDPRSQRLPLPDDVVGEGLRFVVAHEVGHTLGLPHNGKSSAMVPTEWLRRKDWTSANGTAGSIMDYARFNYVAQPGDNAQLMPMVGAYDKFSIAWGYRPIEGARTPNDEAKVLDSWAAQQVTNPLLRFYDNFNSSDPTALSEALGDDATVASTYGVKNLKRVMGYLAPATVKLGEDYSELRDMYGEVWGQFGLYISHVSTMIGGVEEINYFGGRGGGVYSPLPKAKQKAAVNWLLDNVLTTPTYMVPNTILNKIGNQSGMNRVAGAQRQAINGILNEGRINRMIDNEIMNPASAYTVEAMLGDARKGVWKELSGSKVSIDAYRRAMQRQYVSTMISRLNSSGEMRNYMLADLRLQRAALTGALPKAENGVVRAHMEGLVHQIKMAIEFPPAPAAAPAAPAFQFPFVKETAKHACTLCAPRVPIED